MATVKFLLQSTSTSASIYVRLSLGRGKTIKSKTGLVCDYKRWSKASGFPIAKNAQMKDLKASLVKLEGFLIERFNKDYSSGKSINKNWLDSVITQHFDQSEPVALEYLTTYLENLIEVLPYKTERGKKGIQESTIKKYRTVLNKLRKYEEYHKKKFLLKDIDLNFRNEIIRYFTEVEKLADNTLGRYIKVIKTVVVDARKNGYEVNPQIDLIRGFGTKTPKVVLSFGDLQKIKKKSFSEPDLEMAKDWLIIGCYTGQRVSDLMRMNSKMIQKIRNFEFIVLDQVKTGKTVQIPIHYEVKEILNKRDGEFPPRFAIKNDSNSALFNKHLKTVCRRSKIEELCEGNLFDKESGRLVTGQFEKWRLVSSHICRRSFATNFYSERKYPTPLLMNITAHSTEKMFLEYIGKKPIDYSLQLAEIWSDEVKNKNYQPTLTLVKNAN